MKLMLASLIGLSRDLLSSPTSCCWMREEFFTLCFRDARRPLPSISRTGSSCVDWGTQRLSFMVWASSPFLLNKSSYSPIFIFGLIYSAFPYCPGRLPLYLLSYTGIAMTRVSSMSSRAQGAAGVPMFWGAFRGLDCLTRPLWSLGFGVLWGSREEEMAA